MIQENKEILLKDLCGRLPYGVKILDIPANVVGDLFLVSITNTVEYETNDGTGIQTLYNIKPYLRPMSSMTDEEEKVFSDFLEFQAEYVSDVDLDNKTNMFDWLNSHYFDYRGLIEKGLALEAKEGMYKTE